MATPFLVRLTKEATWGVFDGSALSADVLWIDPMGGEACKMQEVPGIVEMRTAGSGTGNPNLRGLRAAVRYGATGTISGYLHVSQASHIIPWGFVPAGSPLALPSYTIDVNDGVQLQRYLGCRVSQAVVRASVNQDWFMFTYQIVSKKRDTTNPTVADPAPTVYPSDQPFRLQDCDGFVTIDTGSGAVANHEYDGITITARNILYAPHRAGVYISRASYKGRDLDIALNPLTADNTLWQRFRDQATVSVVIEAQRAGKSLKFDAQDASYIDPFDRSRDFSRDDMDTLTFRAHRDPTTGVDCAITVADLP
jgi:hypothetical protein